MVEHQTQGKCPRLLSCRLVGNDQDRALIKDQVVCMLCLLSASIRILTSASPAVTMATLDVGMMENTMARLQLRVWRALPRLKLSRFSLLSLSLYTSG